jgi:nucleotide-binding universal stress UspA family protein
MTIILVPLDMSSLAERVLPRVRHLAPLLDATVHLLHVIDPDERFMLGEWSMARSQEEAEFYLEEQAAYLEVANIPVITEVGIGKPCEVILRRAAELEATLIAMPTHALSGLRRWAIGSVTDRVVHAATAPVYIVRGDTERNATPNAIRTVMVTLDGSQLARAALQPAIEIASRNRANVVLLSVVTPAANEFAMIAHESLQSALGAALEAEAKALRADPRLAGLSVTPVVSEGLAAEEIVEQAADQQADLIVMATHGWSGLQRLALGSVADKVLHATAVPLVLVRASQAELATGEGAAAVREASL